jgi:hypothetical protein
VGTKTFWVSLTSATEEIVKLRRSLLRHNTEKLKLLGISRRDTTLLQPVTRTKAQNALQGFGFGDARCHLTAFEGQNDPTDILVLASPRYGGTRTDVTLYFGGQGQRGGLSPDFMAHLLDRLLSNIEMLFSTPRPGEQLLPNIAQSIPPPLQIPLLAHDLTSSHVAAIDCTAAVTATGYRFEDMPAQVGDLVAQAWEYILEPIQDQRVPACDEPTTRVTRFYDA